MRHVIMILFAIDRYIHGGPIIKSHQWIDIRFDLFQKFTLRSILNQYHDDFDLWVVCDKNNRDYVAQLPWHRKVELIFDRGEQRTYEIDDDWLTISRLDSDDLYHLSTLQTIRDLSERKKRVDKVASFSFGQNLLWDRNYGFIGKHIRKLPTPFTTRIFSKDMYKDWDKFKQAAFVAHAAPMRRLLGTEMLPDKNKVCVVKHGTNTRELKQSKNPTSYSPRQLTSEADITDPDRIAQILHEYGVLRQDTLLKPDWEFRDNRFRHRNAT